METNNGHILLENILIDYQTLINKIPGIISSKFIADINNDIIEVHILSDTFRSPKQLVRDIQSAILTTYNVKIDHKIISIAQIEEDLLNTQNHRLSLQYVNISSHGPKSQAEVMLSKNGESYKGVAQGGNSTGSRARIIAEATLMAVHSALNVEYVFVLSYINDLLISGKKTYVVSVSHLFELGEEMLCGCCMVKRDENEAVVKATLDAINRRIIKYFN